MRCWLAHPADTVADFQQFYGVELPPDPAEYGGDPRRLALLWTALPRESRTARRMRPELEWDDATRILRLAEHSLRVLAWMQTKDAAKGANFPRPIELPWEAERRREDARESIAHKDGIARILGIAPEATS